MERPTCQPTIHRLPFNPVLTGVKFTVRSDESLQAGRRRMNLQLGRRRTINPAQRNIWPGGFHTHINLRGPLQPASGCCSSSTPPPAPAEFGAPLIRRNGALRPWGPRLYVCVYLLGDVFTGVRLLSRSGSSSASSAGGRGLHLKH